jgi:hypothetical protein
LFWKNNGRTHFELVSMKALRINLFLCRRRCICIFLGSKWERDSLVHKKIEILMAEEVFLHKQVPP